MGFRFNTNTWRAPLQLIDCWLPVHATHTDAPRTLPLLIQRFTRAGWLKPSGITGPSSKLCASAASRNKIAGTPSHTRFVRVHSLPEITRPTPALGGRLALSGRMGDVCAELDRLAALELTMGHKPAVSA